MTHHPDPRAATPRLGRRDVLDAAFILALTGIAIFGLRSTFSGHTYLVTGMLAALIGIALAALVSALRLPTWLLAPLLVLAYFVFGGVLVFRNEAPGHVLPSKQVVQDLGTVLVDGWKQLLTTLPPVAGTGRLLAIPYLIGLLAGGIAACIAQRTRTRFAPALPPGLALAAVLLLGTAHPAARLWQGIAFGCVVVAWAALRGPVARPVTARGTSVAPQRLVIGVLVLAVAGAGAAWLGPRLPGAGTHRVVLRNYVKPPFDIAAYPSPLVGFRKFTKDANLLYDQTLFNVRGVPKGVSVRIATLDDYDGSVWGATNGLLPNGPGAPLDAFQRVGSRIATDVSGRKVSATITIAAPYAAASDLNAWVPIVGTLRSVTFRGKDAHSHEEAFRYNLATGSGVVAERLAAGDRIHLDAIVPHTGMPSDAAPYGTPTLDASVDSFVASRANQWSAKATGVIAQTQAVARYLRDNGAYSDGGPGEGQYLPGHSIGRLTAFLNASQLVGDDEQYAATYALICNYLGLPARVVLLAQPEANGVVQGKDVHAAVEVHVRTGNSAKWVLIPNSQFMPDRTKKPNKQPPQTIQNAHAAVVPPPNPVHPPSTLDEPDRPQQNTQHLGKLHQRHAGGLAGWVSVLLYGAAPVGGLLLICAVIVGLKWRRRVRRRTRGAVPDRFDAGWREFVDRARDLGATVPPSSTRYEQARSLAARPGVDRATGLAAAADAGVFGPGDPPPEAAAAFWHHVDAACRALTRDAGRLGRLRAALNLRSLRRPTQPVRVS